MTSLIFEDLQKNAVMIVFALFLLVLMVLLLTGYAQNMITYLSGEADVLR